MDPVGHCNINNIIYMASGFALYKIRNVGLFYIYFNSSYFIPIGNS